MTDDVPFPVLLKLYGLDHPRTIPATEMPKSFIHNPFWIKNMRDAEWMKLPERRLIGEDHPDYESEILQVRKPGEFSGLINPGTICYANSTLQFWFHNPIIRNAILSSGFDQKNVENKVLLELHNLFGHLKFSIFRNVNPRNLYLALELNYRDQHDAQEFGMILSDKLSNADPDLKKIFDENFFGQLKYVRKCRKCQSIAENEEQYSIVDFAPHDTLEQAFGEKFTAEVFDGCYCETCKEATQAERTLAYLTFPPVLQFQVNRYKYNIRTNSNIKITRSFTYPDECDFQPYIAATPDADHVYAAFAALIHYGPNADRGHYVMKVRNHQTGIWHIFSDTSLDESEAVEDGMNESDNVYMVMYIKKSILEAFPLEDIVNCGDSQPEKTLKDKVAKEDALRLISKTEAQENLIQRHSLVKEMVTGNKDGPIQDFEFFGNKWVRDLLRSIEFLKDLVPVENVDIRCRHEKVAIPKKINGVPYRVLPQAISEKIYETLGGGPRLVVADSMCQECAKAHLKRYPDAASGIPPEPMDMDIGEDDNDNIDGNITNNMSTDLDNLLPPPSSSSKTSTPTPSGESFNISCILERDSNASKSPRRDVDIAVDETKTLLQLKFVIGKHLNVRPADIMVDFKGQHLVGDDMTVSQFGIKPGDSIKVILAG